MGWGCAIIYQLSAYHFYMKPAGWPLTWRRRVREGCRQASTYLPMLGAGGCSATAPGTACYCPAATAALAALLLHAVVTICPRIRLCGVNLDVGEEEICSQSVRQSGSHRQAEARTGGRAGGRAAKRGRISQVRHMGHWGLGPSCLPVPMDWGGVVPAGVSVPR